MIPKMFHGAAALGLLLTFSHAAQATVVVFPQNAAGFHAAAGSTAILNFDALAPGTNLAGTTIGGIQFIAGGAAPIVVAGASTSTPSGFIGTINTATNVLTPTSGANLVSPGGPVLGPGPNPSNEDDSLTLKFSNPLVAFGLDLIWQSADGASFTRVKVYDPNQTLLYSALIQSTNAGGIGGGAPGGSDFWGIITGGGETIGSIHFQEFDDDHRYPDSNIGYDTFYSSTGDVPEPATFVLVGAGLLAAGLIRRK